MTDKPFVLGKSPYYRLVSVPSERQPGRREIKYEAATTNNLGERVFVACNEMDQDYFDLVSSVMHELYRLAHPAPATPNT